MSHESSQPSKTTDWKSIQDENGVDLSLIRANLRLSPEERLRRVAVQTRRIRVIAALFAAGAFFGSVIAFFHSPAGQRINYDLRSWLAGYDGCACDECALRIIGTTRHTFDYCRMPLVGWGDASMVATRLFLSSVGLVVVAAFGARPISACLRWRAPEPGHCVRCGYDLSGTPGDCPCPECGDRLTASGPTAARSTPRECPAAPAPPSRS